MHFIHRSKLKEYQFLFNFFIVDRRLWGGTAERSDEGEGGNSSQTPF